MRTASLDRTSPQQPSEATRQRSRHREISSTTLTRSRQSSDDGLVAKGGHNLLCPTESVPHDSEDSADVLLPRSFPREDSLLSDSVNSLYDPLPMSTLAILPDELVCIGLAPGYEDLWQDKLIRALFFGSVVHSDFGKTGQEDDFAASSLSEEQTSEYDKLLEHFSRTPTPSHLDSSRAVKVHPQTLDSDVEASPFVSFTQTAEGASLTADLYLLRKLFDEDASLGEGVILAVGEGGLGGTWIGEPGIASSSLENDTRPLSSEHSRRGRSGRPVRPRTASAEDWQQVVAVEEHSSPIRQVDGARRLLKCLQLDLSSFGLDKYGIVHRFADLLTREDINLVSLSDQILTIPLNLSSYIALPFARQTS